MPGWWQQARDELAAADPVLAAIIRAHGNIFLTSRGDPFVTLARSIVGSSQTIRVGIEALVAETGADELIVVSDVYDHAARLRSFELIASSQEYVSSNRDVAVVR